MIKEPAKNIQYIRGIAQIAIYEKCPHCDSPDLTYKNNSINPDALQTRWVICDTCKHEFLNAYYTGKITDNIGNDISEQFKGKRIEYHGVLVYGFNK